MTVDVLILAAGAARRFGGNKLLALWNERPLLEHVLEKAAALDADSVNLVLGGYAAELEVFLKSRQGPPMNHFFYSDWQLGMGSSLAFGVVQLPPQNAVLVLLADQPLIELADLQKLLALGRQNLAQIVCAEFAETRGVPALFPPEYKNRLKLLSGDRGAKALLCANDVITLPLANAAVDIDLPSDLALLPNQ
jgi:molybdenum cofactor cytidylyltransferase